MSKHDYPQIKVCGLTRPEQAQACVELGADAIGVVFYSRSPRNVSIEQAVAIRAVVPPSTALVGVVVEPSLEWLLDIAGRCGLDAIQLHGAESPAYVHKLRRAVSTKIIKALFDQRPPEMHTAGDYPVDSFLVECGRGPLPGGNAMAWDWGAAKPFAARHPLILAGGLGPETVEQAIAAAQPDAVDASSALEAQPGLKDLALVERFIESVRRSATHFTSADRPIRPIFTSGS
jgi:phosphoribosylanthranilate isomerase